MLNWPVRLTLGTPFHNAATKKLSSIQWKQSAFDDGPDTDDSLAET